MAKKAKQKETSNAESQSKSQPRRSDGRRIWVLIFIVLLALAVNAFMRRRPDDTLSRRQFPAARRFEFGPDQSIEVPLSSTAPGTAPGKWKGVEAVGQVWKRSMNRTGHVRLVRGLLPPSEVRAVLEAIQNMAKTTSTAQDLDTVDKKPQFQMPIIYKLQQKHTIADVLAPAIQERLLPYIRDRFRCPQCVACEVLARRYLPSERQDLPLHFDEDAFATVLVGLSSPAEYTGGLYLQSDWHVDSRKYIEIREGDAFVHQFDLNHGIDVKSGSRYSLIFWFKDSKQSCLDTTSPWYREMAEEGDVDAQFNLGNQYRSGRIVRQDYKEAVKWLTKAAKQGHALAQSNLGYMYLTGEGVQPDIARGVAWNKKAAELGSAPNQVGLGKAYAQGAGGLPQDLDLAAHWIGKAAEQGDAGALDFLEKLLSSGEGPEWLSLESLNKLRARSEDL